MARTVKLDDGYLREEGTVYLSGIQALVRMPMDQNRRDRRRGLSIGTFITGFPGSPLAGYDLALRRVRPLLERYDIVHVPGANEELAASAVSGTQMLDRYPHSRYDGVVGIWYGKGPGVDRSGDALKHGNFAGTSQHGAVVILSGEDHEAKSSTMPYQDDYAFESAGMPILYPASVAEFLELGLHAVAISRYSGCWVALKLAGPLVDGGQTVDVAPELPLTSFPDLTFGDKPFGKKTDFTFFPGLNIETERQLYYERHRAALAYARAHHLNRVVVGSPGDRLGIVSAGKSDMDTRQALSDMGLDEESLRSMGVRLLRVGMIYPLDEDLVREFSKGLEEVIVIEEKRGFLEARVKQALCGLADAKVLGKLDERGDVLFPIQGGMDADDIAENLGPRLLRVAPNHPGILHRLSELSAIRGRQYEALARRTPNYCSGCPHNISTRLLEDQVAWGSPGCHSFASLIEQPQRHIVSMTQLGGEGLPWVGLAPFTDRRHIVQNVGDGSLFHSSYLNIRFCVAAGVNITFKILYNGSVANTGAQELVGGKPIPELTRLLEIEGVRQIALVTKTPGTYDKKALAPNTRVYPVEQHDVALKELERAGGVTVYIYDGMCANERRRLRKRGRLPPPNEYVLINEEVCENCGHCGALTNCMSLHRVSTEFGQKTQVHPSSCNQDYSCVEADCPSFVTVHTSDGAGYRRPLPPELAADAVQDPDNRVALNGAYRIYSPGVGGTGVITLNAILSHAALMEGKRVLSYDQTGAAQKWGPVLSSTIIAPHAKDLAANKVGAGKADLYLALDLMAATNPTNLDRCAANRTAAVVNSTLLPSAEMVRQVSLDVSHEAMQKTVDRFTRPSPRLSVPSREIVEALFGDYMTTNLFTLGAAYQAGFLPLEAASIEAAIELNGVQVPQNHQAFRYGRLYVAEPSRLTAMAERPRRGSEQERVAALKRLPVHYRKPYESMLDRCSDLDEESRRLLGIRIAELIEYQDVRYSEGYVDFVLKTAAREHSISPRRRDITHAVIRQLYKLLAYKDEYEVARLYLKQAFRKQVESQFTGAPRLVYHFHPPLLRTLGLKRKLAFGSWFTLVLKALRALRRLRGTFRDPFGYAPVRREERRLIGWYMDVVGSALSRLDHNTYPLVAELAQLPDGIRGYEDIKLENIQKVQKRADELAARIQRVHTRDVDTVALEDLH